MEFADAQVRPGDETLLRVSASDPSSLCAVAVVDKSIELMGTTSRLTNSKVMHIIQISADVDLFPRLSYCIVEAEECR